MGNYFAIEADTVNAAFVDDGMPEAELGKILNKAALRIAGLGKEQDYCFPMHDSNGNKVGNYTRLELMSEPEDFKKKLGDFSLVICCDNAAFFTDTGEPDNREIARIVHEAASQLESISDISTGGEPRAIKDINGNTVGKARWRDYIKPAIDSDIKSIIDSAESNLSEYIDPSEVFSFKGSFINKFFDAHSLHYNPLDAAGIKPNADYTAVDLYESIGDYFDLDLNELSTALLTLKCGGIPNPQTLQDITDEIVNHVRQEEVMIGYENEEDKIEQAIHAFRFPEEAEVTPSTPTDPCF